MKNKFQIVILGGSSSALTFALKSAERGFSTLLIESGNSLGSQVTGRFLGKDLFNYFKNNMDFSKSKYVEEVLNEFKLTKNISFYNNLVFQNYFLNKFEELNISILFNTSIYKIRTTNNIIDHLIVSDGEAQHVIELSMLADCSSNLCSLKTLNNNQFAENNNYNTLVLRFSRIDFVEALADVRENQQNYSEDSSKKYTENDFIKLDGYKNVVENLKKNKIISGAIENLEFVFSPGIDEAMLTFTSKTKLQKNEIDFIINQLKNNCMGFKNIFTTEIKNIEMEYFNPKYLEEIEINNPENMILQNNYLSESEKLNPLGIETHSKLFEYGVMLSKKLESIIKK